MVGKRVNGSPADQLRRRRLRRRLDWSPWLDRGLGPTSNHHVRTRAFININSYLYQDHGGIIHGARGPNVNIALGRPCCFSRQQTCVRRHCLLKCLFNDRFGGVVRNLVYNNPGKFLEFRWRNLWQSMILPEPCQIWTGIWTSLGRGVQHLARTSFGRSNR